MSIDEPLLYIVLAALTLATALNLFLTLRIAAIVRPETRPPLLTLPIGQAAAPFAGRSADGHPISTDDLSGQPAVLVFLSSACPACRETAAELSGLLPAMRDAGVGLWIIPADATYDLSALLDGTPLADHLVVLDAATRGLLNPQTAVPLYIFLDDKLIAQASNYVGDENWQSFVEQMRDVAAGAEAAS